jgi:hypothetical protein
MLMAAFEEFSTLHFIIINSCWAGAPTQEQALKEQALKEYLRRRMQEAVRSLSVTADVLGEVLIEIMKIQDKRAWGALNLWSRFERPRGN